MREKFNEEVLLENAQIFECKNGKIKDTKGDVVLRTYGDKDRQIWLYNGSKVNLFDGMTFSEIHENGIVLMYGDRQLILSPQKRESLLQRMDIFEIGYEKAIIKEIGLKAKFYSNKS